MDDEIEMAEVLVPIGKIRIQLSAGILNKIKILPAQGKCVKVARLDGDFKQLSPPMQKCVEWMLAYFNNIKQMPLNASELPLPAFDEDSFTSKVYKTLTEEIGPGKTISYGDLASLAGRDRAARAVGSAMKRNDLPIVIPCHRVVKNDGGLGNYSSYNGCITKEWLIKHEQSC
ncbi:Methylated-DNA--protein-cysteine methyltransferase [Trichoplax sp. H2]|uniref:Methylated-DNA--protein-cysteine methyltransferase n=1 Tax=Trichoplax adhaerens TaxID=10228 RepID=B3RUW8_TRIAD|nr:hypothetical protein TRIADDRAFT_55441 [Trichoplax adhaerens]EDV25900.1 hypothetical protein TRIADDRAFT_55441 [Trichoplax adhaerens]RDD43809.1 Methylated-DNA--protein-cysteine methyltransferase [Trichoplax sp. H2]|eukprot:XP_002111933.1 hypothetical protein TRIADDRAFT_55441 [Trichoplax adhaerens]